MDRQEALAIVQGLKLEAEKEFRVMEVIRALTEKRTSGSALPAFWSPSDADYQYGLQLGLSEKAVLQLAEEMRDWAGANRNRAVARKADWDLTFKGWMRRHAGKARSRPDRKSFSEIADEIRNGPGRSTHPSSPAGFQPRG